MSSQILPDTLQIRVRGDFEHTNARLGDSLLVALKRLGYPIKAGCRSGGCGICKVRVLTGSFERGRMSAAYLDANSAEAGFVLACRTFLTSDLLVSCGVSSTPDLTDKGLEIHDEC